MNAKTKIRKLKKYEFAGDKEWKKLLYEYAQDIGIGNLAKEMKVSDRTVHNWLFTERIPYLRHRVEIYLYLKSKGNCVNVESIGKAEFNEFYGKLLLIFLSKGHKLMASEMGVSEDSVYYWINDKKRPSEQMEETIDEYLKREDNVLILKQNYTHGE